ncbi:uncharacterized protein [Eleutherodactylus coqui]|uniref:uncharacterized protein isoform X3 n=1 Tax=Eleutherodactylus coqui TaxID=57060 RepID=UPI0034623EC2
MGKKKRGKVHFKCNLCDAQFNSEKEKAIHKNSSIHTFMVGVKRAQQSYMGKAKTLNEQILETGRREPLIGLEYIYEYAEDSEGVRMYECKLCESAFRSDLIFFHIVGIQHRVQYLVKHHPIMGIEADFEVELQGHYRKLASNALAIEQIHGRKKITVVNEVYVSKPEVHEISNTDTGPEDEPIQVAGPSNTKPARRPQNLSKYAAVSKPRSRDDDNKARFRQHDRGRESRRDSGDVPRFPHLNPNEDFDARTLRRAGSSDPQPNSKDDASKFGTGGGAKMLPDTKVGPLAQPGINRVSPFQPTTGGGPQPQDAFEDTDFRRRNIDRGGPSVMPDRGGDRAAAGDTKDQNRRGNRSPDPHSRMQRPGPAFDERRGGDIDVRSVLPSGGISFRELREAHERNKQGGFSAHLPPFEEKKEKDTDSDMEVCSMEFSDCEPDDFWCNEELFDFLKSYYIGDHKDVRFILEAINIMSEALVRHKSRKEVLQRRILEEKQRLEEEKQKFLLIKKRKENKITSTSMKSVEPGNIKLFKQVTGAQTMRPSGTVSVDQQSLAGNFQQPQMVSGSQSGAAPATQQAGQVPQAEKINQPAAVTDFHKALVSGVAPIVRPAVPRPRAAKAQQSQQPTLSQKAFVSGVGPLLQQLFVRPPAPENINQPQQVIGSQKPPVPGTGGTAPVGPQHGQRPQDSENRFNQKPASRWEPVDGAASGPGSRMHFNPNQQTGFNDPRPSNQRAPFPGQGGVRYSGSRMHFNPNQQTSGPRFNNPHPSNQRAPFPGQAGVRYSAPNNPQQLSAQRPPGPANRFNLNPGPRFGMRGPVDGAGRGLGPGSETRFSQNPASRFNNPNPPNDQRNPIGPGTGRYAGSLSRFNQNAQYSDSWYDDSGPQNKRKPPVDADQDADYNQMAWDSGPQSGDQGFYNEPQTTGMGAGRYGEQYNQTQWQSQSNRRGAYGSGVDRPLGPRGPQPTAYTGFSSDRQQNAWPSQNFSKPGVYPTSILKNRTGNPP